MSIFAFFRLLSDNHYRLLYIFLLITSLTALAFAYYVEYVMKLMPCALCIYQRIPYAALVLVSMSALAFVNTAICNIYIYIITFIICIQCIIASYHSGVEHNIFKPSALCSVTTKISSNMSINEIKKMLYDAPVVSCTKPALVIFGLSMTEWNLLINGGLLMLIYFCITTKFKERKLSFRLQSLK